MFFSLVSQKEYAQNVLKETVKGFFNGSLLQMVSHFVKNKSVRLSH
jgi:predicted transcriptional regulator